MIEKRKPPTRAGLATPKARSKVTLPEKVTGSAPAREVKPRITYSDKLFADILDRIALGEPLTKICNSDDMPTRKSVFEWVAKDPEIQVKYEFAMQMRADLYAEETICISDETHVEVRHQGEDVVLDLSATAVARNRLRIDARKWYASKLNAKKYGDAIKLSGGPLAPMVTIVTKDFSGGRQS